MKFRHLLTAAAISLAWAVPAAAQTYPDIVELSPEAQAMIDAEEFHLPQSNWRLRPSESGCSVRREFARGDDHVTFIMRRLQPGMPVQYALFGTEFSVDEPVEAGFTPGTGLARYTRLADASIGQREGFVYAGHPFPVPEGESRADERALAPEAQFYVVQGEESEPVVLRTGPIGNALDRLADCAAQGLTDLGVDVQGRSAAVQSPRLLNHDALYARLRVAYPGGAIRDGRQGPILVRAIVNPAGDVTHCHVASYLTARALREAACETMLEYAEFEPALDASGEPTTGYHVQRIIFYIDNPY